MPIAPANILVIDNNADVIEMTALAHSVTAQLDQEKRDELAA